MSYKKYAPAIARIGVGFVFLVFGIWQLVSPEGWFGYLPSFVLNTGVSASTFILFNGIFDLVIGLLLILGLFLKVASVLGILHILGIVYSLGWNDVAVRDIGLLIVLISVLFNGPDDFCLQKKRR